MDNSIKVFAPATVANVACAFDILGFALDCPGDEVLMQVSDKPGVEITAIHGDQGRLPLDPDKNTASVAVKSYLAAIGSDAGFKLELIKNMPCGSGLGSSAASAVAAVVAASTLLGDRLDRKDLLPFVMQGEKAACGTAHADNVAPALLGGFILIRSYEPLEAIKIPAPDDLYCVVIHPHIEIQTEDARKILRKEIYLSDAVKQWGNIAALISSLYTSDYDLLGRSLVDYLVEPTRSVLIPGFTKVKQSALANGALGCGLSGSGPSMFSLCKGQQKALVVAEAMKSTFANFSIDSDQYISGINTQGAVIVD